MMGSKNILAVVLAAGESRRMGQPKMLLPFNGKPMIRRVIENIRDAGLENILVVIGAERDKLPILLEELSVNFSINTEYHKGMLSSVITGIKDMGENISSVLIFPGDQPLISPDTIIKVLKSRESSGKSIFIPVYRSKRGHPLMIDAKYKPEILKLNAEKGLRSLAELHPEDVYEVQTDDPGILKDFDTYDQYLNEINQIS